MKNQKITKKTNICWIFEVGAVQALFMVFRLDSKGAKVCILYFLLVYIFIISFSISVIFSQKTHKCKSCRHRQELSNEYWVYWLAKIGFDTAEKEPLKVWTWFGGNLEIWRGRKSSSNSKYLEFEMRTQLALRGASSTSFTTNFCAVPRMSSSMTKCCLSMRRGVAMQSAAQ